MDPTAAEAVSYTHLFHTGYRGRTAVFEILTVDHSLRRAIADSASREEIRSILSHADFLPLSASCIQLVHEGVTTVEEAARTINTLD